MWNGCYVMAHEGSPSGGSLFPMRSFVPLHTDAIQSRCRHPRAVNVWSMFMAAVTGWALNNRHTAVTKPPTGNHGYQLSHSRGGVLRRHRTLTLPMNRIFPVRRTRSKKRKGWSARNSFDVLSLRGKPFASLTGRIDVRS